MIGASAFVRPVLGLASFAPIFALIVACSDPAPALPTTPPAASEQVYEDGNVGVTAPTGWERATAGGASTHAAEFVVRPPGAQSVERFVECSLARETQPVSAGMDQTRMNAFTERLTEAQILGDAPGHSVISFKSETVGPVRVATIVHDWIEPSTGRTMRDYERQFAVVRAGTQHTYFLWCGATQPTLDQDASDIEQFLTSLRFQD